jgi:hypothetical protein
MYDSFFSVFFLMGENIVSLHPLITRHRLICMDYIKKKSSFFIDAYIKKSSATEKLNCREKQLITLYTANEYEKNALHNSILDRLALPRRPLNESAQMGIDGPCNKKGDSGSRQKLIRA